MKELYPNTAVRIAADCPDAKFIYVVRHPLRRIESFWMQKRANGSTDTDPDFNRAIVDRPDIFIESTDYLAQLRPYRDRFPLSRFRIAFFEDLRRDQHAVMREIFSFLDVDPDAMSEDAGLHVNPSEGKLVFTPSLIRIRRAKWLWPLKRLLPDDTKQRLAERFFRKPMSGRPEWSDDVRRMVLDRLVEPSRTLLGECGKPVDFWELDA